MYVFVSGVEGGEWMRGLGLDFTNMCLCFGCCSVGGVGLEWVGGLDEGLEGWGGVLSV